MIRNAALLTIILLAAPVVAAEPPNPMATPAPTAAPKINTDLKVAPGILLGRPKPAACPGAVDTRFTWSSCSGAPGTQVTVYGPYWVNAMLMRPLAGSTTCCGPAFVALSPPTKVPNSNGWAYTFIVPPLCYGAAYPINLLFGAIGSSFSGDVGSFTMLCAKTTAPKPAACPGAKSTDIFLSSCSDAPGTHLTLTTTPGKNVTDVQVLFKQNAGGKMTNYSATVGRSAGAYTLTVPPLCNGGTPSFSLVASYISLDLGRASVTKNLGNFTAICSQTAQATASPAPKPTASPSPKPTASPAPVPATVQAAVDLLTGSRDAVSSSSCGTTPSFNCPNLTPQSTKIRIARNAAAISQNPAGSYSFSATVSAASLSDIPFIYSGTGCFVTINTAQGSSPAIVTGTLTFTSQNPGGSLNQLSLNPGLQISGVTASDLSVHGDALCTISGFVISVGQAVASLALESALHDRMGNSVCIVRGPALVGPCQRH